MSTIAINGGNLGTWCSLIYCAVTFIIGAVVFVYYKTYLKRVTSIWIETRNDTLTADAFSRIRKEIHAHAPSDTQTDSLMSTNTVTVPHEIHPQTTRSSTHALSPTALVTPTPRNYTPDLSKISPHTSTTVSPKSTTVAFKRMTFVEQETNTVLETIFDEVMDDTTDTKTQENTIQSLKPPQNESRKSNKQSIEIIIQNEAYAVTTAKHSQLPSCVSFVSSYHSGTFTETDDTDSMKMTPRYGHCELHECGAVDELIHCMRNVQDVIESNSKTNRCLSYFTHLITTHDTNDDFEYIYNKLDECKIRNCVRFERNHRNRSASSSHSVNEQMIDRIHCYYYHSYDIGHRLTKSELNRLQEEYVEGVHEGNVCFNVQLSTLNDILDSKHKIYRLMRGSETNRDINKFMALNAEQESVYSFGYEFLYEARHGDASNGLTIKQKYSNFKEELLQNNISKLSVETLNKEIERAERYYNDEFRKQNDAFRFILVEHLLAVMLYCNFDQMQQEFSRTYRKEPADETVEHLVDRHSNFYFLAKHLKEAISQHGTNIKDGDVDRFYHGISQEMIFPQLLTKQGVKIFCPLSTSSSYHVATNFAGTNHGLIVEFADGSYGDPNYPVKYFSCGWLSDFVNESEFLFIQLKYGGLRFVNITHAMYAMDFGIILSALQLVDDITSNKCTDITSKHSLLRFLSKIMEHQLSLKEESFAGKKMKKLHYYAQKLVQIYCENKKEVVIHWQYYKKHRWMVIKHLTLIFPHMERMAIMDVDHASIDIIQSELIQCVINCQQPHKQSLHTLRIKDATVDIVSIKHYDEEHKTVSIEHMMCNNTFDPILELLEHFTNFEFDEFSQQPLNKYLSTYLSSLITEKIHAMEHNHLLVNHIHYAQCVEVFEEYIHRKLDLKINWNRIIKEECKALFDIFGYNKYEWIDLELLHKLFPNVKRITLSHIKLSDNALQNLITFLTQLMQNSTFKIETISILDIQECSSIKARDAVHKYYQSFAEVQCILAFDPNTNCITIQMVNQRPSQKEMSPKMKFRRFGSELNGQNVEDLNIDFSSWMKSIHSTRSSGMMTHTMFPSSFRTYRSTISSYTTHRNPHPHHATDITPFHAFVPSSGVNLYDDTVNDIDEFPINIRMANLSDVDSVNSSLHIPEPSQEQENKDDGDVDSFCTLHVLLLFHIVATATDVGVIVNWYQMEGMRLFTVLSILSVLAYRCVSSVAVAKAVDVNLGILQFFDVLIYKQLYDVQCNVYFHWIRRMESTLESFMQIVIQLTWILNMERDGYYVLVIVSICASVCSVLLSISANHTTICTRRCIEDMISKDHLSSTDIEYILCDWHVHEKVTKDYLFVCIDRAHTELLIHLFAIHIDMMQLDNDENTILHKAVMLQRSECVDIILIYNMMSIKCLVYKNRENKTALEYATIKQNKHMIHALLRDFVCKIESGHDVKDALYTDIVNCFQKAIQFQLETTIQAFVQRAHDVIMKTTLCDNKNIFKNLMIMESEIVEVCTVYMCECLVEQNEEALLQIILNCITVDKLRLLKIIINKYKHQFIVNIYGAHGYDLLLQCDRLHRLQCKQFIQHVVQ
eukprot:76344_1